MKKLITKCKKERESDPNYIDNMNVSDFLPNYAGTSKEK
jgi:hypothetical protein